MKKCYSLNNEDFSYQDLDDAALARWDDGGVEMGDIATIWEADPVHPKASEYLPVVADELLVSAAGDVGEHADSWDFSKAERESLQLVLQTALDNWADENDMHPKFYRVTNEREIQIRFTSNEGDFEVVNLSKEMFDVPPEGKLTAHNSGDGWHLAIVNSESDEEIRHIDVWPDTWPAAVNASFLRRYGFEIV